MVREGDVPQALADFSDAYATALSEYVDAPVGEELVAARELGRAARRRNLSILQVVGRHLEIRRGLVIEQGLDRLVDMDRFLSAVLAAYDDTSGELPTSATVRGRADWLRGLSDAYLAIASGLTLDERMQEVCLQARRFFGAADARLVFGRESEDQPKHPPGDTMTAQLLGSAALLTVYAEPGGSWTDADRTMLGQLAALISAPINDARRLQAAEHTAELGRVLGGLMEPHDVIARFRSDGVALLEADVVMLVGKRLEDGGDPPLDELPADVLDAIDAVADGGEPRYLTDRPATSPMVWAVLPVVSTGERYGVLAAGFADAQPFDEVQQSFLRDLTTRLGAALERSHAYANEQRARREAEQASARWRDLQDLAVELARASTRRRVAQALLRRALAVGRVDSGMVATYSTRPHVEVLAASRALRTVSADDADRLVALFTDEIVEVSGDGIHYVDVAEMPDEVAEHLRDEGVIAVAGLPIVVGARQVGMFVLARRRATADDEATDSELLRAQVAMAGATLQRAARYDSEHAIADTLQRSLLELPAITVERVRWAVQYRAGSAGLAGGDWYDLIDLGDQRVAIVVGDVVGRGVEAAAAMGQLRSAIRALASHIDTPAALVDALSRFAGTIGPGRYASLVYLVLDASTGRLDYTVAGHLPPVVQRPDGSVERLTEALGPVLGVSGGRRDATVHLSSGSRLIAYTDGLVERRGESIDAGIDRLIEVLEGCRPSLDTDSLCRELIDRLVVDAGQDDIAIVAVQLEAPASAAVG
jgi:serine phosphatase RsbU (regulator of sigma subunit)